MAALPMVERVVRALLHHQFPPLFAAAGADDDHPRGPGQLHRGNAHPPGRPVDKDGLAGGGLADLEQGPVGGRVRDVDRRALPEGYPVGKSMHLVLLAQGLLGVCTRSRSRDIDALAHGHLGDARPKVSTRPAASEPGV